MAIPLVLALLQSSKFRAKCVGNKMLRQIQNFSIFLGSGLAKDCQRLSRSHSISCRQWLRHTSAFSQELLFSFLTVETTYSTNIILFTSNTLKQEKQRIIFLLIITLFRFLWVSLL